MLEGQVTIEVGILFSTAVSALRFAHDGQIDSIHVDIPAIIRFKVAPGYCDLFFRRHGGLPATIVRGSVPDTVSLRVSHPCV